VVIRFERFTYFKPPALPDVTDLDFSYTPGGFIHVLPVIAVEVILILVIQGRKPR